MSYKERILDYLWSVAPGGATNGQIARALGISSQQTVSMTTQELAGRRLIRTLVAGERLPPAKFATIAEHVYDGCYAEDRDTYIDIILVGDEEAARNVTFVEIPAIEDGYQPFYNPDGPGPEPLEGVRYTAPGPPDLEPVIIALDDPMRVDPLAPLEQTKHPPARYAQRSFLPRSAFLAMIAACVRSATSSFSMMVLT